MRVAMPDTVRRLPLDRPRQAVVELTEIVAGLRDAPTSAADLEALATEAVELVLDNADGSAVLLAVVTHPDAAPALLTGVLMEVPGEWDSSVVMSLRDAVLDAGGPDVRDSTTIDTELGRAVVVQRVPGPEQVRDRRPLTLQLQAFVPWPGTGQLLLLTLACPSSYGWTEHQRLLGGIVASAGWPRPGDEGYAEYDEPAGPDLGTAPVPTARSGDGAARRGTREDDHTAEDSFETHTYRL